MLCNWNITCACRTLNAGYALILVFDYAPCNTMIMNFSFVLGSFAEC